MKNFGLLYKEHMAHELEDSFKSSNSFIIANFNNLKVEQSDELRNKLRKVSSRILILKNSIARRALKNAQLNEVVDMIDGACTAILTQDEAIGLSRIVVDFTQDNESLTIRGGYSTEIGLLSAEKIKELAKLPSLDVLRAQFARTLKAPISGFYGAIRGVLKNFISVLDQLKTKKQNDGGQKND